MKKLLLCSVVVAFASLSLHASDAPAKTCADKAKASSCCPAKAVTKTKADSTAKGASQLIAKR
ncbi:MAG: hypothetical protein RJA22_1417 [Verrucomicrobiota bacterium]|jgi:hypothetical protein